MSGKPKKAAKGPAKGAAKKGGKSSKPGTAASGDSVAAAAAAATEEERKRLQAELDVAAAGRAAQEAAARALEAQLAALQKWHTQDAATAADVMASQQRQQQQAQGAARALERQLEEAQGEVAALQRQLEAALTAQAETQSSTRAADGVSSEKERLKMQLALQEDRLATQATAIEALRLRLHNTEAALTAERGTVAALQVKVQSRSELRFIRGAPFLVHIGRQRVSGATMPPAGLSPGNALGAAGRQLVLAEPAALHVLDLATCTWWANGPAGSQGSGTTGSSSSDSSDSSEQQTAAAAAGAGGGMPPPGAVVGRAVCSVGSKLLGFGGECDGKLLPNSTYFLHPDLQAWLLAPPPAAGPTAPQPPPRMGAALAYCPRSQAAFMYGGQGEGGTFLGDLWRLDLGSMVWTRLDKLGATRATLSERTRPRTPACHEAPPALSGAALAVAPDGSRLWLMGGRLESGRCSSSLHWFDIVMNHWVAVEAQTWIIDSREQHVMACLDPYLVVAGGLCHSASGQALYRQDVAIYDPAANTWDLISDTAFEPAADKNPEALVSVSVPDPAYERRTTGSSSGSNSGCGSRKQSQLLSAPGSSHGGRAAMPFLGTGTCVFSDGKLLLLKAPQANNSSSSGGGGSSGGQLSELWTVDVQLPSVIDQEQLRSQQRTTVQKDLTLKPEYVGSTVVRLSWCAPTAGKDKVLSFKLMVTNSEGRAREAYEGPESGCEVTGLTPSSEYVFCVKALFDDSTFLWSEPVMVTTKKAVASGSGGNGGSSGDGGSMAGPRARQAGA